MLTIALLSFRVALFVSSPEASSEASPELERGPGNAGAHYRAGQAVEIWQNHRWLPGKIQAVGDGHYFVFYDGFSVSWNEWVDVTRLRPAARGTAGAGSTRAPAR